MQTQEGETGRGDGSKDGWDRPLQGKKGKRWKGDDSRELLTLSSPDHQSVTSLSGLGLGQDVLQVKNTDQYAGHRSGEGRVVERVHSVYCSSSPLPLSDHNTNDTVSLQQFINTLTGGHAALLVLQMCYPVNDWVVKKYWFFDAVSV